MPSLPRVYYNEEIVINKSILIYGEIHHYLYKVRRLKQADKFSIFNEKNGEFCAVITEVSKYNTKIIIEHKIKDSVLEKPLTLIFAPIKNPNASFIIQKATELGVTQVIPVLTERTIVKHVNKDKLGLVAIEAAEQCERFDIPRVYAMEKLEHILRKKPFNGKLIFCDERLNIEHNDKDVSSYYNTLKSITTTDNAILVGPEGGFTPKELSFIRSLDFVVPVSLGTRILRAETAIIFALSVYQAMKGSVAKSI